jgi:hypothetical protein
MNSFTECNTPSLICDLARRVPTRKSVHRRYIVEIPFSFIAALRSRVNTSLNHSMGVTVRALDSLFTTVLCGVLWYAKSAALCRRPIFTITSVSTTIQCESINRLQSSHFCKHSIIYPSYKSQMRSTNRSGHCQELHLFHFFICSTMVLVVNSARSAAARKVCLQGPSAISFSKGPSWHY